MILIVPVDYKSEFLIHLRNRLLVKTFVKEFSRFDATSYAKAVARKLKQFKESDESYNEPELICRICEQTMPLKKYIVWVVR